jgi:hypothetical protein
LSSTRQANHHRVRPAGESADQPLNRVFEWYTKNVAFFGRPLNQSREGAFPQAQWVTAAEPGTRSLLGTAMGPYRSAEQSLALDLLGCFGTGMLVFADRKFLSRSLARAFLATDARILRRASSSFALRPVKVLPDGTYLAELKSPRRSDGTVITVGSSSTPFTLQQETAPRSPRRCSTLSPICSTPRSTRRWTWRADTRTGDCETVIGHHNTDMGQGQPVLCSSDPKGLLQEMWALFAVYQAICQTADVGAAAIGIPRTHQFPARLASRGRHGRGFP